MRYPAETFSFADDGAIVVRPLTGGNRVGIQILQVDEDGRPQAVTATLDKDSAMGLGMLFGGIAITLGYDIRGALTDGAASAAAPRKRGRPRKDSIA